MVEEAARVLPGRVLGRYILYDAIASGGMGSVHLGRLVGTAGFSRTVAIKKLHPHLAGEREFVAMLLDEARLVSRIRHPNVVPTLDVLVEGGEVFLVMEYVHGESVSALTRPPKNVPRDPVPPPLACAIAASILHGLHAAHEAESERGEPLHIVHRDVSPQNVIVGVDGAARLIDFGVAKAAVRLQSTKTGAIKGKLAYMAPEQLRGGTVTRSVDIYGASIVLWEMLTGRSLFKAGNEAETVERVLTGLVSPPSQYAHGLPKGLDELVLRGLERTPASRFATAEEMAIAIERTTALAPASELGDWTRTRAEATLAKRAEQIARMELATSRDPTTGLSAVFNTSAPSILSAERPRQRRTPVAVFVLGAPILALLGVAGIRSRAPQDHATVLATAPKEAEVAAPAIPRSAEPAPVAPPPVASEHAPKTAPAAALPPTRRARPTPVKPRPECDPPYTPDPSGVIRWKAACL
jgi:serine/threonine-protein kinase